MKYPFVIIIEMDISKSEILELLLVALIENNSVFDAELIFSKLNGYGIINEKSYSPEKNSIRQHLYQKLLQNSKSNDTLNSQLIKNNNMQYITSGGYGHIYKTYNSIDKKIYAIKSIPIENEKVIKEAEIMAQLNHKNIVRYHTSWLGYGYDPIEEDSNTSLISSQLSNNLYIQMEYCHMSLHDWLLNKSCISLSEKKIMLGIAQGVRYLHGKNIIHGDLKTGNILIGTDLEPKICDFGTPFESIIGLYVSPETEKRKILDKKTDIFSLGIIFFELLYPMITSMERFTVLHNLRKGKFPLNFPIDVKNYLQRMIGKRKYRPSCHKIVKFLRKIEN